MTTKITCDNGKDYKYECKKLKVYKSCYGCIHIKTIEKYHSVSLGWLTWKHITLFKSATWTKRRGSRLQRCYKMHGSENNETYRCFMDSFHVSDGISLWIPNGWIWMALEVLKMELKFKHFIILNALDVLTTYFGLTYLGLVELNTFANGLFQEYGLVSALIGMKIVGLMVLYGLMQIYPLKVRKLAITACCLFFMVVVLNNIYWLVK